jgi:23S rRNA (cytidine1920-2'-O)/16S rRNA (cytidine1409-2'-O)-methyltransferase
MVRQRLDSLLVKRGYYATRSRARDAILRGTVKIGDRVAQKPGEPADEASDIAVLDRGRFYVSRAALKLLHALDRFALSPAGLNALDLGASSGGFTQVLLERGAAHVTALDVGHGQLAASLRSDPRVTVLEGVNARDLEANHLKRPVQFVTADVSFISLKQALPGALALASPGAQLVALIKPQFEAGLEALDASGVVRDADIHAKVCSDVARWLAAQRWRVIGMSESPVQGGDGNREFLIAAEKPQ